jgi:hypothetical protein
VRVFDADQAGPIPYIAMECISGRGLDRLLEAGGPLAPGEVLMHATQAAAEMLRLLGDAAAILGRDA